MWSLERQVEEERLGLLVRLDDLEGALRVQLLREDRRETSGAGSGVPCRAVNTGNLWQFDGNHRGD